MSEFPGPAPPRNMHVALTNMASLLKRPLKFFLCTVEPYVVVVVSGWWEVSVTNVKSHKGEGEKRLVLPHPHVHWGMWTHRPTYITQLSKNICGDMFSLYTYGMGSWNWDECFSTWHHLVSSTALQCPTVSVWLGIHRRNKRLKTRLGVWNKSSCSRSTWNLKDFFSIWM